MSETEQSTVDPIKRMNRIVDLAMPLLGLLFLAAGIAQAVRGEPTPYIASSVVGGITWLAVSGMILSSPPRDQPARALTFAVMSVLVVAGGGFAFWFTFQ